MESFGLSNMSSSIVSNAPTPYSIQKQPEPPKYLKFVLTIIVFQSSNQGNLKSSQIAQKDLTIGQTRQSWTNF